MTSDQVTSDQVAVHAELRALAERYARGCDQGDGALYAGVFLPDATVRVFRGDDEPSTMQGVDVLVTVPEKLGHYDKTFHFLGQSTYEVGDDEATGEVYCLAHHLTADRHGGTNYVMHIRYQDTYRTDGDGRWKIADRRVNVDWTDTRVANAKGR